MARKGKRPIYFWDRVEKSDGCWVWTGATRSGGYGEIGDRRLGRPVGTHRFAYELMYGPIPDGLWVLHKCDNPPCCRPDHLFLGTVKDNTADMVAKGRTAKGKLPEDDVRLVLDLHTHGLPVSAIRDFVDLPQMALWAITQRESYRWVEPSPSTDYLVEGLREIGYVRLAAAISI